MSTYISVNVVSQSLILISYLQKNNCTTIHDIQQIKLPIYINRNVSFDFAIQCGWIKQVFEKIILTPEGTEISRRFNGLVIESELWRLILFRYITVCQPAWSKRIPYGRKEAYFFMNEEEQRCFIEAGLIDGYDKDVVEWWDCLAEIVRAQKESALSDIGRDGERLTLQYEEIRTGSKPDWRSLETNRAGYDILSQRSLNNCEKILIEVKTSRQTIESASLILSRHEWETASMKNNVQRYLFYLWDLSTYEHKLAIISVEEMSKQIPKDNENGQWENVRIPYRTFLNKFTNVSGFMLADDLQVQSSFQHSQTTVRIAAEVASGYGIVDGKVTNMFGYD